MKRYAKLLKLIPFLVLGLALLFIFQPSFMTPLRQTPQSGLDPVSGLAFGPPDAYAQAVGPPVDVLGRSTRCQATAVMSAGVSSLQLPCLANFRQIGCNVVGLVTPTAGAGNNISCGITAVATVTVVGTASATFTAQGFQVLAATANASPTIQVWGVF